MTKLKIIFSLLFVTILASAQDVELKAFKTPLFSVPDQLRNNTGAPVWVEIIIPIDRQSEV